MHPSSKYRYRPGGPGPRASYPTTTASRGGGQRRSSRNLSACESLNTRSQYQENPTPSPSHPDSVQDAQSFLCPLQSADADPMVLEQPLWGRSPNQQVVYAAEDTQLWDDSQSNALFDTTEQQAHSQQVECINPAEIMMNEPTPGENFPYDPRYQALPHSNILADLRTTAQQNDPRAYHNSLNDPSLIGLDPNNEPAQPLNLTSEYSGHMLPEDHMILGLSSENPSSVEFRTPQWEETDNQVYMSNLLLRSPPATAHLARLDFYYPDSGASNTSTPSGGVATDGLNIDFSSSGGSLNVAVSQELAPEDGGPLQLLQQFVRPGSVMHGPYGPTHGNIEIHIRSSTPGPCTDAQRMHIAPSSRHVPQDLTRLRPSSRRQSEASSSSSAATSAVFPCPGCSNEYSGMFGKGNLARHKRLKHNKDTITKYPCKDDNCDRVFLRQDARLKHHRRCHAHLQAASPILRGSRASDRSNEDGASQQMGDRHRVDGSHRFYVDGDDQDVGTDLTIPTYGLPRPARIEQEVRHMRFR